MPCFHCIRGHLIDLKEDAASPHNSLSSSQFSNVFNSVPPDTYYAAVIFAVIYLLFLIHVI